MSVLRKTQFEHDEQLPPPMSEASQQLARSEWLYNAAEELARGGSVVFKRHLHPQQGVTAYQFALAVDEYANNLLADCGVGAPALGYLLIAGMAGSRVKSEALELLGQSDHSLGKLGEIAERLLQPLVDDALIAQAEDNEL
ncbi:hypothetical protein HBO14_06755 [Pseudomonas sp. WS 5406]|uniref:hypothetical protein n=1 Tax=Pseudomonas sp. WS 5406 TaxID=2717498 RepID=UPI001474713B|nr:hypothetical protein [Pseudomonas sp. WS 5406]NMX26228.1 hypothetical protein [Pseudomonas sp. WS 5406]